VANAGIKFTETEPLYGPAYGQLVVSLLPRAEDGREVQEIVEAMRADVEATPGRGRKSFTVLAGGPPTTKAVSVKVRGDDYAELRAASDAIRDIIAKLLGAKDITDDDLPGRPEMRLTLDREAVARSGLSAGQVARLARLYVDGEIVQVIRDRGEKSTCACARSTPRMATPQGCCAKRWRCPAAASRRLAHWCSSKRPPAKARSSTTTSAAASRWKRISTRRESTR
jgi:Cu/Ag efflux pump CusA